MNFFGGGNQQAPQGPDPVFAAKTEMEMYTVSNKQQELCDDLPSRQSLSLLLPSTTDYHSESVKDQIKAKEGIVFLSHSHDLYICCFLPLGFIQQNCRLVLYQVRGAQTQGCRNLLG